MKIWFIMLKETVLDIEMKNFEHNSTAFLSIIPFWQKM